MRRKGRKMEGRLDRKERKNEEETKKGKDRN